MIFRTLSAKSEDKLYTSLYKGINAVPIVSNVIQQQVQYNYYQVKMEVKRLIGEEVLKLKGRSMKIC